MMDNYRCGDINDNTHSFKKKRKRKKKEEISRKFTCGFGDCKKAYGTENSLNQHIKLKHKEFWNDLKKKEEEENDSGIDEENGVNVVKEENLNGVKEENGNNGVKEGNGVQKKIGIVN